MTQKSNGANNEPLFEGQGDHIDAVIDDARMLEQKLPEWLEAAHLAQQGLGKANDAAGKPYWAIIRGLVVGQPNYLTMVCCGACDAKSSDFYTLYPVFEGAPWHVVIDKVTEWKNGVEARIDATWQGHSLCFFPTDYYYNKKAYQPGSELVIDFSFLAMVAKKGMSGFDLVGEDAANFRKRIGAEPEFDADGNIAPVHISTEGMTAFFQTHEATPDEAEFQSPIFNVTDSQLLDVPFFKGQMHVYHDSAADADLDIPIYIKKSMYPDLIDGQALQGYGWLTGRINQSLVNITNDFGRVGSAFQKAVESIDWKTCQDVDQLLAPLDRISLPNSDDHLIAESCGEFLGGYTLLYVSKDRRQPNQDEIGQYDIDVEDKPLDRVEYPPLNQSVYVDAQADKVTAMGVWQAFLLDWAWHIMPLSWHGLYDECSPIFDVETVRNIQKVDCSTWANGWILPDVKMADDGKSAIVELCYWNEWQGLVHQRFEAKIKGRKITFEALHNLMENLNDDWFDFDKLDVLVPYDCGIDY